jgi:serine/threonine protein phosphatase PrpC
MPLVLAAAGRTHIGLTRSNNEDSFHAGTRLLAVADGVGGAAAGEVASAAVIAAVAPLEDYRPGYDLLGRLHEAILAGNAAIAARVAQDAGLTGMGTTLTAVLLGGSRFGLVNVGDSRTYLLRDGELTQLSHDDSYVQLLIDEGRITRAQADIHPQRSVVLQALTGVELVEPAMSVHEARADDRFLLCSDGLSDHVSPERLARTLTESDRERCADALIELALNAGGRDNITAIVADVVDGGVGESAAASAPALATVG